ncbi:MAG: hypothetical protein ABIO55_04790 [Ginsengibacter sp.]
MKTVLYFFLSAAFCTCHKNTDEVIVPYSEASYNVIVAMTWAAPL